MYHIISPTGCLTNSYLLASGLGYPSSSLNQCHSSYLRFCNDISGLDIQWFGRTAWLEQQKKIDTLLELFTSTDKLTDLPADCKTTSKDVRREVKNLLDNSMALMEKLDPTLAAIFNFFVHTIFFQRTANTNGGSTSSAPGVIWFAPRRDWTVQDGMEFLIHELTHTLIFIDERINGHYVSIDSIADPKNYATSSILEKKRPLDKVVHSFIVSVEILLLRRRLGEPSSPKAHPPNETLLNCAITTSHDLRSSSLRMLMTEHLIYIIDKTIQLLETNLKFVA